MASLRCLLLVAAAAIIVSAGPLLDRCGCDAFAPPAATSGRHQLACPTAIPDGRIRPARRAPMTRGAIISNASSNGNDNAEDSLLPRTTTSSSSAPFGEVASQLRRSLATLGGAAVLSAAVLTSPVDVVVSSTSAGQQHSATTGIIDAGISVRKSQAWAMTENQQFVSDVWWAVTTQYFDPTYNGLGEEGWRVKKKEAVAAVADFGPEDDTEVANAIKAMLSSLNDPYTRYLPREKFEALTAYARGGSAGIGVTLLENPRTNRVVVMGATRGGPAESAGIRAGDVILSVDGESMEGATAEVVAAKCRGEPGGKVDVVVLRGSFLDGSNDGGKTMKETTETLSLTRAKVKVNPVESSTFVSASGRRVGLLKVPSFSQETSGQIVDALRSISSDGGGGGAVDAIAIDLRGNVGGYMPAGVDVAKLFLPPRAHIIAEVGKGGAVKGYDADGIGADTTRPVYLLVDSRTASAAEIFAAALQDNRRALVVGTSKTFGKGRIQNVQPLENGSGVAVTRARYVTPSGRDLHGVGIKPNREPSKCEAEDSAFTCLADIV